MDHETEVLKQHIAQTRESLSEKIDCLEQKVLKTVEGTTDIVANTAESVAEAVTGTVQRVTDAVDHAVERAKESLDLHKQVEARPWTMFSGSIAAGFIGGCILHPSRSQSSALDSERSRERIDMTRPRTTGWEPYSPAESQRGDRTPSLFAPALRRLKELAITATSRLVNDLLVSAAPPELHDDIRSTVSEFASALRGQPLSESPTAGGGHLSAAPNESESTGPQQDRRPINRMASPRGDGGNGRH